MAKQSLYKQSTNVGRFTTQNYIHKQDFSLPRPSTKYWSLPVLEMCEL